MNAKKLMSLLTAICLIVSCFAGVVSAAEEKTPITVESLDKKTSTVAFDQEDEGVSVDFDKIKMEHDIYYGEAPEIVKAVIGEANVVDQDNADVKPYKDGSYKVTAKYDEDWGNYCDITIEMEELKLHNSDGAGKGFWTGFSIEAPKDVKYLQYSKSFGNSSYGTVEVAEGEKTNFYLNVAECDMWEHIRITWLDAEHNNIADSVYYYIDLSGIKLSADEYEFGIANVCDSFPGEAGAPAKVYKDGTYKVNAPGSVIDIDMEELVMHKNAQNKVGYWTGFSVTVPEGAAKLEYTKSFGDNIHEEYMTLGGAGGLENYKTNVYALSDAELDEENPQVSFYIDVMDEDSEGEYDYYEDKWYPEYVILQWLDAEGNAISRAKKYELDLDGVDILYPEASKITAAVIADCAEENTKAQLVKEGTEPKAELEGNTIVLSAEDLEKHTNGAGAEGHWIGFAVEAPEGATHYEYVFGDDYEYSNEAVTKTDAVKALEENEESISFYVNASEKYPKSKLSIRWYIGEDREYTYYPEYYYIDITDVDLADAEVVEVTEAIIADNKGVVTPVYDEGTYDVSEENGVVTIKAKGLKTHYNGNNVLGAWIGAKVSKPEGAAHAKFFFGEYEGSWEYVDYVDADEILDADGEGVSFYFDAFDITPKNTIMIQWFDEDNVAITNRYVYTLDISGVEYEVDPEATMTVEKANIVDQANVNVKPYLGEYDAKLDGNTIVLSADFLREHQNGEGVHGAWIGFKPLVEGAKYVKYVFGYGDWYYDSNVVEAGESFYVDAFDNNYKDELTLQFFDENGKALTNVNTYKIDIEDVQVEAYFFIDYSKISLAGDNARLYNLADSTHYEWVSTADYVFVDTYAENGSVKLSVEGTDESNGGNVFYRNPDRKVKLTATPDSGYKFVKWLDDGEEIGTKATIELTLDKCYDLEAVFEKGTSSKPAGNGGGGLQAGGDKSNAGADDLGQKDEDKTEGTIVPSAPSFFVDVPAGAWYYSVVKEAYDKGLMNGVSATTFAPSQSLTRGMFVTILYRLAGSPEVTAASSFADVPANQYYADAVAWASANSIVNGVSADKFAPNNNITREQMAAIIHRYAVANNIEAAGNSEVTYSDSAKISEFAKAAVEWATNAGVLSGNSDGTFAPLRTATRAEAAAIFVRLLGLVK